MKKNVFVFLIALLYVSVFTFNVFAEEIKENTFEEPELFIAKENINIEGIELLKQSYVFGVQKGEHVLIQYSDSFLNKHRTFRKGRLF